MRGASSGAAREREGGAEYCPALLPLLPFICARKVVLQRGAPASAAIFVAARQRYGAEEARFVREKCAWRGRVERRGVMAARPGVVPRSVPALY